MARFLKSDLKCGGFRSLCLVMPVRVVSTPPRFHESTENTRDFFH